MQTHPEWPKVGQSLGSNPLLIDDPRATHTKLRPSQPSSVTSGHSSLPFRDTEGRHEERATPGGSKHVGGLELISEG